MRQIKIDGKTYEVRALRRAEIRALSDLGIGSARFEPDRERFDEVLDRILETQFDAADLDGMENPDLIRLYEAVIAETWTHPGEEKNSKRSGNGSQTESG